MAYMGLFDSFMKTFSEAPEWKGTRFEEYLLDLFPEHQFDVIEMTHSFKRNEKRFVESSLKPDYILRHKKSGQVFAVEAKYRSGLNPKGMLEWAKPYQLDRYREFAQKEKIPVYIAIGFAGDDDDPKDMFLIPLEEAKFPALYPSVFQKFSRNPKKEFYWSNGKLY